MLLHDWTRVTAGTFHDFHFAWIAELRRALNGGLLPDDYYAQAEQRAGPYEADLLTLEQRDGGAYDDATEGPSFGVGGFDPADAHDAGGLAVLEAPPEVAVAEVADPVAWYATRQRSITIRSATDDRIVALLEIVSPGNKDRPTSVERFVDKAVAALQAGCHLLIVDPFPPGPSDPEGVCDAVWREVGGIIGGREPGRPIGAAGYEANGDVRYYAQPMAAAAAVPPVPLFYEPGYYVPAPLADTYARAYEGVPKRWRRVIEATS